MALPNLKSYINAVINPKIRALSILYDENVLYMQKKVDKQTELLLDAQTQSAELSKIVFDLQEKLLKYQMEVIQLRKNMFTGQQVREMLRRLQELNYIAGILYQKYVVLAGEQDWPTEDLPEFRTCWVPGDSVKTEEEVERDWRMLNGIEANWILDEEQQKALQEFKDKYYRTHYIVPGLENEYQPGNGTTPDTVSTLELIQQYQENTAALFRHVLNQNLRLFNVEKAAIEQRKINDKVNTNIADPKLPVYVGSPDDPEVRVY